MQLLDSNLTHGEIVLLTGITCTKRKMAKARRGEQPHLSDVLALLESADKSKAEKSAKLIGHCALLITKAKNLLSMDTVKDSGTYIDEYQSYIDLKVIYNRLAEEPRNHGELLRLHQLVRTQHDKSVSKMSA